jgi:hypothetical protein
LGWGGMLGEFHLISRLSLWRLSGGLMFADLLTDMYCYSPGRFFAVSTLKLMLAYLVLEFDMKPFPKDRQPQWVEFGGVSLLKEDAYVTMKKRDRVEDQI